MADLTEQQTQVLRALVALNGALVLPKDLKTECDPLKVRRHLERLVWLGYAESWRQGVHSQKRYYKAVRHPIPQASTQEKS